MTETVVETKTYKISFGDYRAQAISLGAGLHLLERVVDGQSRQLTETYDAGSKPPLGSGMTLAPWPNRIRDGKFDFGGTSHELEITEPAANNAIHGLVRRRNWDLVEHTDAGVQQSIEVGQHPGWPYSLRLTVTHELSDDGLTVTHTATNEGPEAAPFGLGIHPFIRVGDVPIAECTLEIPASEYLPLESTRNLPEGPPVPVAGTENDFTAPRPLAGVWLDTPFTSVVPDSSGIARYVLRAPDGTGTVLWADDAFGWVQVFTAYPERGKPYLDRDLALAVEPMTCPPDAFNSGLDVVVLEPGQVWVGKWGVTDE
jgi:aldose 1-epimerase